MPINAVCPECRSAYLLADQQAGKKVRCKKCQEVFLVPEAPSRRTATRGEGVKPASERARPSAVTARRDPPNRKAREDEEDWDEPRSVSKKSGKSSLPWIIGGAIAGVGVLVLSCGGLLAYLLFRGDSTEVAKTSPPPVIQAPPPPQNRPFQPPVVKQPLADNQPIQGTPVTQPANPTPAAAPPPAAVEDTTRNQVARGNQERKNNGRLSREGRERVKRATVFLHVKMADGTGASGSGFFGCKEARNIVLTNAHVVGMLSPDSMRPQAIEVVVNSGQADEWKTSARILGVDRSSDLAVLDIGTPSHTVPEPLSVKSAGVLQELDTVYVFGFPLGERLGKEITIRDASVSALRNKNGRLDRVQVNGGMDPGSSGGPVVDNAGDVVGVAVSGIPGRQINFAIPGERVHTILDGRISDLVLQQPYQLDGNKLLVPVAVEMIDPRNLIKEVGLEVWTGDKPADARSGTRPPAATQPAAQPGDSSRLYYKLTYRAPEGRADITLPALPSGKVYWQQPKWVNAKGEARWAAANPMRLGQPVSRTGANLVLRYTQGNKRQLDLTIENIFKVSNDDDSDTFRVRTTAGFTETVASTGSGGTTLTLRYRTPPRREIVLPNGQTRPSSLLERIKDVLPRLVTSVQLDRVGNIVRQSIALDGQRSVPMPRRGRLNPSMIQGGINRNQLELMAGFHEMIQQGLESLSVSLPSSGTVKPLESWRAERQVPIDTPGKTELGKLDVTFTYLGMRKRNGRDEAVISMNGVVRGKGDGISGKASGQVLVDLASGQTLLAEATVKLQLEAILSESGEEPKPLRVLATMRFHMQRKLQL